MSQNYSSISKVHMDKDAVDNISDLNILMLKSCVS